MTDDKTPANIQFFVSSNFARHEDLDFFDNGNDRSSLFALQGKENAKNVCVDKQVATGIVNLKRQVKTVNGHQRDNIRN